MNKKSRLTLLNKQNKKKQVVPVDLSLKLFDS